MYRHIFAAAFAAAALTIPFTANAGEDDGFAVPPDAAHAERWQGAWDRDDVDARHVILGRVADFEPYRLTVARRDGGVQTIDLKVGTVIRPRGATPQINQRVAAVGYYSRGTFIANRIVLR